MRADRLVPNFLHNRSKAIHSSLSLTAPLVVSGILSCFIPGIALATCGNGIVERGEQCDGGTSIFDCCSASCQRLVDGASCNDGLYCNGADQCSAGSCSVHGGNPCPGPDGDSNCAESCNETTNSCIAADKNGAACDDGLYCNGPDTCASGTCSGHTGRTPCAGADGDSDCSESCNEAFDTCSSNDPEGSACNDGIFCNGADKCSGGLCNVHPGDPCPGPDGDTNCSEMCNELTDDCTAPDPNASSCNDGSYCNGADRCTGGTCSVHISPPCAGADGDSNCSESCNEATNSCGAPDPDGSDCDDGLYCNGPEKCGAGVCNVHLSRPPCGGPDGDADCSESCDETSDSCTANDPNGSGCQDGLFCNGADKCSNGTCSVHSASPCPGADGDSDCTEMCNEAADDCSGKDADGTSCEDGKACTSDESCEQGACVATDTSGCAECGNDIIDEGEECDDGDALFTVGEYCRAECLLVACGKPTLSDGDAPSSSDALFILKAAVHLRDCDVRVCDVNGDGEVVAKDALMVLKAAVHLPVTLQCSLEQLLLFEEGIGQSEADDEGLTIQAPE